MMTLSLLKVWQIYNIFNDMMRKRAHAHTLMATGKMQLWNTDYLSLSQQFLQK